MSAEPAREIPPPMMMVSGARREMWVMSARAIALAASTQTSCAITSPDCEAVRTSSALDVVTEASIAEVIQSLGGSTTVITIAHRLSSVRNSDRIVYIEDGKAIASGTFDELREKVPNFDKQAGIMGL